MFEFIKKALSGSNEAEIKRLRKTVEQINALEGQMQKLSDEEMRAYTGKLRERAKGGEDLDKLLPEAYALVREAAVRALGQRPFDLADSDADMPAGVDADSADRLGDGIGVVQDALDLVTDGAGEGNDRVDRREDVEDPRHRVVA